MRRSRSTTIEARCGCIGAITALVIFAGCERAPIPVPPSKTTTETAASPNSSTSSTSDAEKIGNASTPAGNKTSGESTQQATQTTPATITKTAEVGAGAKGHYSQGFITTPLSTYFRAQERLAFEAQIPHAIQLFEATNGRPLKSHQEFMTEIIQANRINLPELPQGHKYVYDPKKKVLMIEQPAPGSAPSAGQ